MESWIASVVIAPDGKTSEIRDYVDSAHLSLSSLRECKEWIAGAKRAFPRRVIDGMITCYTDDGYADYAMDGTPLSR